MKDGKTGGGGADSVADTGSASEVGSDGVTGAVEEAGDLITGGAEGIGIPPVAVELVGVKEAH